MENNNSEKKFSFTLTRAMIKMAFINLAKGSSQSKTIPFPFIVQFTKSIMATQHRNTANIILKIDKFEHFLEVDLVSLARCQM